MHLAYQAVKTLVLPHRCEIRLNSGSLLVVTLKISGLAECATAVRGRSCITIQPGRKGKACYRHHYSLSCSGAAEVDRGEADSAVDIILRALHIS